MNIVIAIPTYNENKNIGILISKIRSLNSKYKLDILIIDDNSPDGTSETINYIQQNEFYFLEIVNSINITSTTTTYSCFHSTHQIS